MSNTWKLMKLMVKMQLSFAHRSTAEKSGYLILAVVMIPFGLLILTLLNEMIAVMYEAFSPTGDEAVILGILFVLMTVFYCFITIGTVLSSFYFAEDVESFVTLPFHPYQIAAGKAAVPFLSLYGINAVILLPALGFYGLHSGAGILYYCWSFFIWLLLPVLPFVLTAIAIMFIMRFVNISKNKDRSKVVAGLLGFVFVIGINVVIRLESGNQDMYQLAVEQGNLLGLVTKFLPTAYISSSALTAPASLQGILYLILMIGISAGGIALFFTIGQKLYFKGVLGLSGGKRNTFTADTVEGYVKKKPLIYSLCIKEVLLILRTPTFFTQIFVQSLILPVLAIVLITMEMDGPIGGAGAQLADMNGKTVILASAALSVVIFGSNPASISSISRDGKSWFNHLYLPVPPSKVIMSKMLTAYLLNAISLILLSGAALWMINIPLPIWGAWFILSLIISWIASAAGVMLDLYSPKLDWTDEREVFKGRFIGIVPLAIEALVFGVILVIVLNINSLQGLWPVSGALFIIFLLLALLTQRALKKLTERRYHKLL
ncbi:ABC transporter permease [Halobacillus litoralis]|uniref:ABC transporter permease n=1 Tax=Halobacillus litoralis TaxID=45668 RepID=A0A845DLN4_9BACI|nr:ABC transporter permease [Halobacillus litoralis]MYL18336.1 ABC transporter permease [Halobacillus litoralis]